MRLSEIESKQLLPRFAHDVDWIQQAFDVIVKRVFNRSKSIDAPLTLNSIQALTDEELQMYYEQFGVVSYYPDLSRETRENMLFELCRIYRYLGTPHAIETLCKYIFDGVDLDIKVHDNLAFDADGNLTDSSLLDVFDVEISPDSANLGPLVNQRILANIINFSRNSQALRDIYYEIEEDYELNIYKVEDTWNPQIIVDIENDAICEPVPSTGLEVLSGVKFSGGNFAPDFITSWGACNLAPTTQADADALTDLGLTLQYAGTYGPYGSVLWDDNFTFEPLAVYTDIDGTTEYAEVDVSGLSCQINFSAGNSVAMYSQNSYWGSQAMTWKCRITKNV